MDKDMYVVVSLKYANVCVCVCVWVGVRVGVNNNKYQKL
jgi:hypothetical protein